MPRKPSASRSQIRRIGLLGLLLTTLLTPAGILVGAVTAAALIGGAFHLNRAASEAAATPHPISVKTGGLQHLSIERDGKPLVLVMSEDENGYGAGVGSFNPANPLFAGLAGDGPARHGALGGMLPGTPIPGGRVALGRGSSPTAEPPSRGPSDPPGTGRPPQPTGDAEQPPGEADDPTKPEKIKPPVILGVPRWIDPQPAEGPPQEILPGPDTSPQAGNPPDPQTPASGKPRLTHAHAVPEPSMLGLMLLGVIAMAWAGRRRPVLLRPARKP